MNKSSIWLYEKLIQTGRYCTRIDKPILGLFYSEAQLRVQIKPTNFSRLPGPETLVQNSKICLLVGVALRRFGDGTERWIDRFPMFNFVLVLGFWLKLFITVGVLWSVDLWSEITRSEEEDGDGFRDVPQVEVYQRRKKLEKPSAAENL